MSRKALLSVRDLEEYFFCPKMFYYIHVVGIQREPGMWSEIGRQIQAELSSFVEEKCRVFDREVYVESESLGVRGRVDYVVDCNAGIAPLEIKYSRRVKPWWTYTLTLYALLVEEKYGKPVKHAYLVLPGPRIYDILITDQHRSYVLEAIEKCRKILGGEYVPRAYRSHSCINCDYRKYCTGE
ncbi:MAG: CRISPR-associated protein Cas4 [Desulfurococcales archaeon ex4484_58]|nr:MAG: CRISPR-associated protein Cas4 [Desulfurococcales archaeon ex4484_58]